MRLQSVQYGVTKLPTATRSKTSSCFIGGASFILGVYAALGMGVEMFFVNTGGEQGERASRVRLYGGRGGCVWLGLVRAVCIRQLRAGSRGLGVQGGGGALHPESRDPATTSLHNSSQEKAAGI